MNLLPNQQKAIQAIHSTFKNAVVTIDGTFVSVTFNNGEIHFLTKITYMVFIGLRGKITWALASRCGSDENHEKVLAQLANYELAENGYKSTFNYKR
tara:strand:+ start:3737 stop:4027 length:291 start_codon:yes stop_codon:yes gene_type:complete